MLVHGVGVLRHGSRGARQRWRYGRVPRQALEVLDGGGQQELVPSAGEPAEPQPGQGEDVLSDLWYGKP